MADVINRKKLLDDIENLTFHTTVSFPLKASMLHEIESVIQKLIDSIIEIIKNSPYESGWISVEDALPENNEIVWVCIYQEKDAYVRKGYIKNELWYTADGYRMCMIPKFWMREYIPEPPKED